MIIPARVLITGATGEIGGALALEYAQSGRTLILQGRRGDRLAQLAEHCAARGAQVETQVLDLLDRDALVAWLREVGERGPLDLVIVNAGMNTHIGPAGEPEPWATVDALLDVNLKAAMVIAQAVLPAMRARGGGQLALVSSLAAYFGLPVTPAYCASKAGLKAYGEALRGGFSKKGVRVNVIMPGYVKSPMCDDMPGPKPFISFPFPLNWGTWWLAVLPATISNYIVGWLGYGV